MRNEMMRLLVVFFMVSVGFLYSQDNQQQTDNTNAAPAPTGAPAAGNMGVDLSQYKRIMLDNFENAELWTPSSEIDHGYVTSDKREGGPKDIKNEQNKYVLGIKMSFFKTGTTRIAVKPSRPIVIKDVIKGFSIWAVGRGLPNRLYILFREPIHHEQRIVDMGRLSYYGWQRLERPVVSIYENKDFQAYFKRTPEEANSYVGTSPFTVDEVKFFTGLLGTSSSVIAKSGNTLVDAIYIGVDMNSAKGVYYSYFDNFEGIVDENSSKYLDGIDNQLDNW